MKKIKFFTSLMSAAVIAATTVLGASAFHYKGDVDRDDDVTIKDIVTVQNVLVKNTTIDNDKKIYIDMNDDNKYNVFDLLIMKKTVKGDIPKEEVPSLTTPPVTTTTTTTTTTIVTTTTVTTTEAETTTSEPLTTTAVTTTEAETTTSKPVTTAPVTTTEEVTTTSEPVTTTAVTTTEAETTTSEPVTTTAVTTTEAETVTSEILTTTAASSTPDSSDVVSVTQVNVEGGKTVSFPLDPTKIVDSMEIEISTETDFSNLHLYIDNWSMWVNFTCKDGVLSWSRPTDYRAVEDVTIEGNKAIVKFTKTPVNGNNDNLVDLKGENFFIRNDDYSVPIDVISIKVTLKDADDQPTEPDDSIETTNLAQMVAEKIEILSNY